MSQKVLKLTCKLKTTFRHHFIVSIKNSAFLWHNTPSGQGLLIVEASRTHSEIQHSVGQHWTGDQPDAVTSAWQHTWLKRDRQVSIFLYTVDYPSPYICVVKTNLMHKESASGKTGLTCVKPASDTNSCLGNRPPTHRSKTCIRPVVKRYVSNSIQRQSHIIRQQSC